MANQFEGNQEVHGQELPAGASLQEFVVEKTLGVGGFGITYLAQDTSLGRKVVIKEHLPDAFSFRDTHAMTVRPRHSSGETMENYQWSMGSFMRESEMLASLEHSNIVRVLRRFEANGTAYFVMPFVEGTSLDKIISAREADEGFFTEKELRGVIDPLLGAFAYLHDRGIFHRDVKPGNILVTSAGIPVLIDFGAARQSLGEKSMTVIESAGYTPFEQTESRGNVGPWSDLYALGGVARKAITFQTPARSADRIRRDPMVALAGDSRWSVRFSGRFLESIDRALRVDEETRWQRADDWLIDLRKPAAQVSNGQASEKKVIAAPASTTVPTLGPQVTARKSVPIPSRSKPAAVPAPRAAAAAAMQPRTNKSFWIGGVVAMLICGGGFLAWRMQLESPDSTSASTLNSTAKPAPPASSPPSAATPAGTTLLPKLQELDPLQWKKLADEGDAFAQALLGESLVTSMSTDAKEGTDLLAKSSARNNPLGIFLFAEQLWLQRKLSRAQSDQTVTGENQARFREAFERGFEDDAEDKGAVWSGALGRAYDQGLGTRSDPAKALRYLSLAGQGGHSWSQFLLGEIYESGRGVTPDQDESIRWYKEAAIAGWLSAQVAMARICARGPESLRDEKSAFEWAGKAAAAGSPRGMAILGELHQSRARGKADFDEALRWFSRAAEKGDSGAQGHLGRIYQNDNLVSRDDGEAFQLLKQAVEGGDDASFFALGVAYETGSGVAKNLPEAVRYYKAGTDAGDLDATSALGACLEDGVGMLSNPGAAVSLYQKASEGGSASARLRLGLLYLHGRSVVQDKTKAATLLRAAADQGLPAAALEWGKCLESGTGTVVDESRAFIMYEKAAKAGIAEAGFRAGLLLEEGRGIAEDLSVALLRYGIAAEAGNASAQVNLGILHAQGRGTEKNDGKAVKFYRMAAEQDDLDGLVLLGMMCEFGDGTAKDLREAAKYYRKAASKGDLEAKKLLENLEP
jgi:TPR repeat protein